MGSRHKHGAQMSTQKMPCTALPIRFSIQQTSHVHVEDATPNLVPIFFTTFWKTRCFCRHGLLWHRCGPSSRNWTTKFSVTWTELNQWLVDLLKFPICRCTRLGELILHHRAKNPYMFPTILKMFKIPGENKVVLGTVCVGGGQVVRCAAGPNISYWRCFE